MKLETFFEKFELFADAPNAVAKMRAMVLELAIQGRLFASTDSSDWVVMRLGEIVAEGLSSVNPADAPGQLYELWSVPSYVSGQPEILTGVEIGSTKRELPDRSILLGKINPHLNRVWKVARRTSHTLIASPEWITITPDKSWDTDFLARLLTSPSFNRDLCSTAQGMGSLTRASTKKVAELVIRRPPLAEQKRIVAKVDELMALCDQLEAQQKEREKQHSQLARASLDRFTQAPSIDNLNFIFHKSYDITPADLKKTILTLAVQGKLVPQDPNDEPAEDGLRTCAVDLKRWAVAKEEVRQNVPSSWTWIRFAGVGAQRLGKMLDARKNRGVAKPYLRNTNVQWMRFELDDVKEMRIEEREEEELRLKRGDLLICEGGEPGRCAIWRDDAPEMYFQKALHRVRPCDAVLSEYLALNLQIDCRNAVLSSYFTGATIKHLTGRSLSAYPIPIPPLAEQRRIVAKVEQLMALVDNLETQISTSRASAAKLLGALVAVLTT